MMSKLLTHNSAPWIALGLSGSLLIGAWIFQYGFGYAPCTMCYWQRHVHKVVIGLAVLTLVLRKTGHRKLETPLIWLIGLTLMGSAALAFYHVGVEYKWWEGPKTCSGGGGASLKLPEIDPDNPLAMFDKKINGPSCGDAVWHFIGLSMAAWNAILSLFGATAIIAARKHKAAS